MKDILLLKKQIYTNVNSKPYNIINELEMYLEKRNDDYYIRFLYAKSLLRLGNIDKANQIFNDIRYELYDLNKINNYSEKERLLLKRNIASTKLRLLGQEEKYNNFVNFYLSNRDYYSKRNDENLKYAYDYAILNSGRAPFTVSESSSYFRKQIACYSEDRLIDYYKGSPNKKEYINNFDYEKVLDEIKKYINSSTTSYLLNDYYGKLYVFKLDKCAYDKHLNEYLDYIFVVTFGNTNEIVWLNPEKQGELFKYIDLNYLKEDNPVKKITIDKM